MKPASRLETLAFLLVMAGFSAAPVSGQAGCPQASGPDAEAGWAAYGTNDIETARERFEAALARCADDQYARTGMGYVALRDGDLSAATSLWTLVVASQPNNVDAVTGLGLAAWRGGDIETVRAHFAHVLELVPDHPTALEYLARVEGALATPVPDAADQAWLDGDRELALDLYMERLGNDPEDGTAALRVALVSAWSGRYSSALELLDDLLERDPRHIDARLARARVRAWSGDLSRAQREVSEVLAVQPDNPEALEALALFQAWSGDVDEALAGYDELISIAPQSGAAGRSRAQTLAWASRYEASRASYDSLLARNPDDVEARLGLAQTLAYGQEFEASILEYDRILQDRPRETRALTAKARTLGWAGRLVEAERVAESAVEIDPMSADAWAGLGQLYRWEGRDALAKRAFETASRTAPTNAFVLDQLRSIDLAFAPIARPTVIYESDSDNNRMVTTTLTGGWLPTPRLDVRADVFFKDLRQGVLERNAQGATVSGRYQVEPGWSLSAGVGGSASNGTDSPTLFAARAGVRSPERYKIVASVDFSSMGLNETAALAELGVRSTEVVVSGRWTPGSLWRVDGSVGMGKYVGTEDNGRRSASLSTSRRLGRFFSLGGSLRAFSFEKNLYDGYFDPDFYGVAELTSYWLYRTAPWSFLVELAPGMQKVTSDGDLGTSLRSNARVGYQFAPGRDVSISFGYSSAGLASFATGGSDYSYTALILGSSWVF